MAPFPGDPRCAETIVILVRRTETEMSAMQLEDHELAPSLVRQFKRTGFVIIENVLNNREIALFLSTFAADQLRESGNQPLSRHKTDPLWRKLVSHSRIVSPLNELLGGTPCVVQSMTAFKGRARIGQTIRNGIALHQDQQYIKTSPARLVGCWIALNGTDEGNGGLRVVPGSHRKGLLGTQSITTVDHRSHSVVQSMRDPNGRKWTEVVNTFNLAGIDPEQAVGLTVPKGAAVFFDGFLVHGSRSNMSYDRERIAVALHYVKEGTWVYRTDLHEIFPVRRTVRTLFAATHQSETHQGQVKSENT